MTSLNWLAEQIAPHMECIVIGDMKDEDKETLKTLVWEKWGRPEILCDNTEGIQGKYGYKLYIWKKDDEDYHLPRIYYVLN